MRRDYQDVTQAPAPEGRGFLFQREAGILVPLGQAVVTGALAFIVTLILGRIVLDWFVVLDYPKVAFEIALVVGAVVCLGLWIVMLITWANNADLKVVTVAQSQPASTVTRTKHMVEIDIVRKGKGGYQRTTAEFPLSDALMVQVVQVLLGGRGFTERGMTGKGKLLTPDEWEAVTDVLEENNIIEWVNPDEHRQGYQLTPDGDELMRKWLEQQGIAPPPPPEKKSRRSRA
jgi:hypothetical protein